MRIPVRLVSVALALLWLSACASVSVDKVTHVSAPSQAPSTIYVEDFETPPETLRVDRSGTSLTNFTHSMQRKLATATVERLNKHLDPVKAQLAGDGPQGGRAWLVSGRFLTVNQGSRLLRTVIGLGAGGTKLETVVTVSDLSGAKPRPFLKFVTSGGTNAQPGAAFGLVMPNYWLIAVDSVGKSAPGLSMDVIRTSREIVAVLSEYMAQEGFLSPQRIYRSKKLGQWP